MISVIYSTRTTKPEFIEQIKKTSGINPNNINLFNQLPLQLYNYIGSIINTCYFLQE